MSDTRYHMKSVLALVCILSMSACEFGPRRASLLAPEPVSVGSGGHSIGALSRVIGAWTGVQTPSCPTCGEGPLPFTVVFKQSPADNLVIDADVRYVAANGQPYHGTATGSLDAIILTINPAENLNGTLCGYRATASLNAAGDRIEGTGEGVGPGPNCIHKRFTFYLTGQSQPSCIGGGTFTFTKHNRLAVYPELWFPQPLPGMTDVEAFIVPAGTWDFTVGTQDPGHIDWATEDPLDEQDHEQVTVPLYDAGMSALIKTLGPTIDIPQKEAGVVVTPFPNVTLTSAIGSLKAVHYWLGRPVDKPLHSVEVTFVTYACPGAVR